MRSQETHGLSHFEPMSRATADVSLSGSRPEADSDSPLSPEDGLHSRPGAEASCFLYAKYLPPLPPQPTPTTIQRLLRLIFELLIK